MLYFKEITPTLKIQSLDERHFTNGSVQQRFICSLLMKYTTDCSVVNCFSGKNDLGFVSS